jgi:hypothetical protein
MHAKHTGSMHRAKGAKAAVIYASTHAGGAQQAEGATSAASLACGIHAPAANFLQPRMRTLHGTLRRQMRPGATQRQQR